MKAQKKNGREVKMPPAKSLIILILLLSATICHADLVFDSGYNTYDDSYGYNFEVWVINDAHLDVTGGSMWKLELMNYATSNIYDGNIECLFIQGNSIVNIYAAGDILEMFAAGNDSIAYLYAYDVTYHSTGGIKNDGWIEGIYISNDAPFSFSFYNDVSYLHLNIVPEPTSFLLFALGVLFFRKRY